MSIKALVHGLRPGSSFVQSVLTLDATGLSAVVYLGVCWTTICIGGVALVPLLLR
jgi:hypothetical protein